MKHIKRATMIIWLCIIITGALNIGVSVHFADAGLKLKENQQQAYVLEKHIEALKQDRTQLSSLQALIQRAKTNGFTDTANIAQIDQSIDVAMTP